jgi:hypothetical protein
MADAPIITEIDTIEIGSNKKWAALITVKCKTEDGSLTFRLTGKAAHQLRPLLNNVRDVGEWPEAKRLL